MKADAEKRPLRLLIVEDTADDAELLLLEMNRGYDVTWTRVDTEHDMRAALESEAWDFVVSDYSMPTFDAPSALRVLASTGLDIPCIVVSGTIDEESAVEALRGGAKDFLLKGKLSRLLPAVERELKECAARAAHRRARQMLAQSEAHRRKSEEQARLLLDSTGEGILGVDLDGRCTFANNACIRMLQQPAFLEGADIHEAMHGEPDGGREACRLCQAMRSPTPTFLDDVRITRADGSRFAAECRSVPLRTDGVHRGAVISFVDITARRRMEEQLRQAQKMDAIGSLAGGIAHDFNNILSVILSYTSLLADTAKDAEVREDIEEIEKAALRAAELTRQLLAFSRQQLLEPRVLELNPVVEGMHKMLQRLLRNDVELALSLDPELGKVRADPSKMEQVIMNLVVNAGDAMPEGGTVTIESRNVMLDADHCERHGGGEPGPHVMISFSDTGVGMDAATRARIFEPFFTTKALGKGTGLGLSTVFGIVKQSGGHIWVYSEPDEGTSFRVYLPRCDALPESPHTPPPPRSVSPRGTETLFVVDDEDQVRAVTKTILERQGYHVLEARNGGEALLVCEQFSAPIHLLITDVVMPKMSGRQLAERIAVLRPNLKVLYISGYTEDSIAQHGVLETGAAFLGKPIMPEVLLQSVRAVLDS